MRRTGPAFGEFDGESDQVLLGSAFDDTRTVQAAWNIHQQPIIEEEPVQRSHRSRQQQESMQGFEDDEAGATQRVKEEWRR